MFLHERTNLSKLAQAKMVSRGGTLFISRTQPRSLVWVILLSDGSV
jgi:hypothetical protein